MRALLAVYDKTSIESFAQGLVDLGWELVSTGGTFATVQKAGIPVTRVEDITQFPEMLDGRVKTLHPGVHGGILARRELPEHMAKIAEHGIGAIDMVVCNLYPFEATVTKPGVLFADGVENIDIGGPAMLRAAAKNHQDVLVVTNPADYESVLAAISGDAITPQTRRDFARAAYQHCSSYDAQVAEWLWEQDHAGELPPSLTIPLELTSGLRYGENPHQSAGFYRDRSLAEFSRGGIATAVLHHGKEMSYNNFLDADAAWNCVNDFPDPSCVVVKHTNPCGVATREDMLEAYRLAVRADATSAFGGIVAFNREVDETLAKEIREFRSPNDGTTRMFYEIVIAPSYSPEGLVLLKGKSKDLRILEAQPRSKGGRTYRQVGGGWLVQDADDLGPDDIELKVVTEKQPTPEQLADLKFAWRCVKHVKSNAITIARGGRLLGMGSGQPNRVQSVELAMMKSGEEVRGASLASDAFFPFAWGDSIEKACQAGVAAIIHPGGSLRDQDGIDCCNKYGVAMVFSGTRHFRH